MKYLTIMKLSLLLYFIGFSGSMEAQTLNSCFQLIPQPQKVEVFTGRGLQYGELTCITAMDNISIPVLGSIIGGLPQCEKSGKGIRLVLSSGKNVPESAEGYMLEIKEKGVTITA